jgi:hypothetical protein
MPTKKRGFRDAAMPDSGRRKPRRPLNVGALVLPSQGEVDALARKFKKSIRKLEKEERSKRREKCPRPLFRRRTPAQRRRFAEERLSDAKQSLFDRFFNSAIAGLCQGESYDNSNINAYGVARGAAEVALEALKERERVKGKIDALKVRIPSWAD